jgi:hypothetical protein
LQIFDDTNNSNNWQFVSEKKFIKDEKRFKHIEQYKDVIDLFIFKNKNNLQYGDGQYSMYVASTNGIFIYDGIDKKDTPKP